MAAFVRANGDQGTTTTLDIGTAGTDRIVPVFTGNESTGVNLSAVTVDGKSCTFVERADNADGNTTELWQIQEAALGASNGSVTVAITGGDAGFGVHAALFTGFTGSGTPSDSGKDTTSVSTDTTTITGIDSASGDIIIFVASHGLSAAFSSWTAPIATAVNGDTDSANPASAKMMTGYAIESGTNNNKTYVCTWATTFNRSSGIVAVFSEGAPTVGIARSKINMSLAGGGLLGRF